MMSVSLTALILKEGNFRFKESKNDTEDYLWSVELQLMKPTPFFLGHTSSSNLSIQNQE